MPKKKNLKVAPRHGVAPSHSIFHNFHTDKAFPNIRAELKDFYGKEHRDVNNRRKTIPALKGRELEAKVDQQMRFLHPGAKP
jgi:hypothetical protein